MPVGQCVHPPLRQTHRTNPQRMRSPRTRSPPARSPHPAPLPASGPFDPGLIPSEGPPRPRNRPPQPVAWAAQGRFPFPPRWRPAGHPGAQCAFFLPLCFLSGYVHRDFLLLSQKAPSPSPRTISSSGPRSHCAVPSSGSWWSGCCCSQWRRMLCRRCQPQPWTGHSTGSACTPCLRAARMLNLPKKPVCARNRLCLWLPHLYATHAVDTAG